MTGDRHPPSSAASSRSRWVSWLRLSSSSSHCSRRLVLSKNCCSEGGKEHRSTNSSPSDQAQAQAQVQVKVQVKAKVQAQVKFKV